MRIVSWNINGLRNGFCELQELIGLYRPDFLCLQKVRCNAGREHFTIAGYDALYSAEDSGNWSGVMTYVRSTNEKGDGLHNSQFGERVETPALSADGHLQVFGCRDFYLVNAYVPFANVGLKNAVACRKQWDAEFRSLVVKLAAKHTVVICGDFNVVHTAKDTCDERLEQNRPNFFRWERDNFDALLHEADLVDAYRHLYPEREAATFYGNYRDTKKGNRIDYFLISRALTGNVVTSDILSDFGTGQSVPILLDLNFDAR